MLWSETDILYQLAHPSDTRQKDLILAEAICLPLALIAVILRLVSRRLVRAPISSDDYMIIIATVFTITFSALLASVISFGFGRHTVFVTNPIIFAKVGLAAEAFYHPAILTTKLSILLFYNRVFPGKRFRNVLIGLGIFTTSYSIAELFVTVFQCVPLSTYWTPTTDVTCLNISLIYTIIDSFNALTDAVILCLPLPIVWQLDVTRGKKLQVSSIFMLGGFVVIIDIIRLTHISRLGYWDISWNNVDWALWSVVVLNTAVVSACLPNLRPLVTYFRKGNIVDDSINEGTRDGADHAGAVESWSMERLKGAAVSQERLTKPNVNLLQKLPQNDPQTTTRPTNRPRPIVQIPRPPTFIFELESPITQNYQSRNR